MSSGSSATQLTGYSIRDLGVSDVVREVPSLGEIAEIESETPFSIPSSSMNSDLWRQMAERIEEARARPDSAGAVVTHGTDTMEETAFFLKLVLSTEKPVVLTEAMRPATALSADGPLNLLNAVSVAADPASRGRGVLVVMNGEIHGARDVTKTHSTSVETFRSPNGGPLGHVLGGRITYALRSDRPRAGSSPFSLADFSKGRPLPRVAVAYGHAEDDLFIPEAALASGCRGLVLAGCGHGTISGAVVEGLERWQEAGIVPARDFNPQKARILLQLALNRFCSDPRAIDRVFREC